MSINQPLHLSTQLQSSYSYDPLMLTTNLIQPSINSNPQVSPSSTGASPIILYPKSSCRPPLPSSEIQRTKLLPVDDVLIRYQKLRCESRVGTLAVKLAREAVFGTHVLAQCTVSGCRELPALPLRELGQLKEILFRQFPSHWKNPAGFELLWATCIGSINQCCKVLRAKRIHHTSS